MRMVNQGQSYDIGRTQSTPTSVKEMPIPNKGMNELEQGDKFKATIVDIQPNKVTIRLRDGNTLTAKSMVLPEARIGEESVFVVKENVKGQILLEMFKSEGQLPTNYIKEALLNAGLYGTEENMELVGHLLKNELPVDAGTLQKAAFFRHVSGSTDLDKVLFMLREDFDASPITAKTLNDIMDKTIGLGKNLSNISNMLFDDEIFEALGKETIFAILDLSGNEEQVSKLSKNSLKELLEQKFFLNPDDVSEKNLNEYFKELYKDLLITKESLSKSGSTSEALKELLNETSHALETMEFTNHINNYKEYMQLPFIYEGTKNQGDLYVFKDRKGQKNFNEQASVLLSMDYVNLGHIEIYINKTKNSLNFQFKGNDGTLKSIGRESKKLSEALLEKGFTISGISFKTLDEPFNVTMDLEDKKEKATKRFSFDMRV